MDCSKSKFSTFVWSRKEKELFPANIIWNPSVPTEVGFFAWEATLVGF